MQSTTVIAYPYIHQTSSYISHILSNCCNSFYLFTSDFCAYLSQPGTVRGQPCSAHQASTSAVSPGECACVCVPKVRVLICVCECVCMFEVGSGCINVCKCVRE